MNELLEPLTPQECDCRGLPFMPLEVGRLVDSDMVALSTGDEFKAALILWAKSWSQVPAASIPDDDRVLAKWAGYSLNEWPALREMALRGWVKCSDGRLYHPVVADLAVKAAKNRRGQSERANSRWARVRAAKNGSALPAHEKTDAAASVDGAGAVAVAMQGRVKGTEESPLLSPDGDGPAPVDEVREAFDAWNATAARCSLPIAKGLDDSRRRSIAKRLKEVGLAGWHEALNGVERSAFCRGMRKGADGKVFRADLGFICQAKSFPRLREGFYGIDAVAPRQASSPAAPAQAWNGPPEVREDALTYESAAWVATWIDSSRWQDLPFKAIVARNKTGLAKLEWSLGRWAKAQGVKLILEEAAAA